MEAVLPLPPMTAFEQTALRKMIPELRANIDKGVAFVRR